MIDETAGTSGSMRIEYRRPDGEGGLTPWEWSMIRILQEDDTLKDIRAFEDECRSYQVRDCGPMEWRTVLESVGAAACLVREVTEDDEQLLESIRDFRLEPNPGRFGH